MRVESERVEVMRIKVMRVEAGLRRAETIHLASLSRQLMR